MELYDQLNRGEITDLALQVPFTLIPGFVGADGKKERPLKYVADFVYKKNGRFVVEDVKGYRTEVYKLKRKLFNYKYKEEGYSITEI